MTLHCFLVFFCSQRSHDYPSVYVSFMCVLAMVRFLVCSGGKNARTFKQNFVQVQDKKNDLPQKKEKI